MHDAGKVLMGTTQSSDRSVTSKVGSIAAGTVVRLKSDDTLSVAKSDGEVLGVSLGKDLSNSDKNAVVRRGLGVPILLEESFTPTIGDQVFINDTTGIAGGEDTGYTGVNAVYRSAVLVGMSETGTEVDAALIDMQGGL